MNPNVNSVLAVLVLFLFGLISPGPNFFVVVQTTLRWGRLAGFLTGVGAATGDTLYAAGGLFGVAQLIEKGGETMMAVRLLGGLYLVWIGARMLLLTSDSPACADTGSRLPNSPMRHFVRGLATDLSNPKTILFFASIFAVEVHSETPRAVRLAMLIGIVITSLAWRFFLSVIFSTPAARDVYRHVHLYVERAFGVALCFFGMRLVRYAGVS